MRQDGTGGVREAESGEGQERGGREGALQRYLEEGVVALLPVYGKDGTGETQVLTLQGDYRDRRSLPWLVERLARYFSLDLAAVRRRVGKQLGLRHHIPLPLAERLVLLPVKVRQAVFPGEITSGYVNLLHVEKVTTPPRFKSGGAADAAEAVVAAEAAGRAVNPALETTFSRSCIYCMGKITICCLNTPATIRQKLQQGETARQELLRRHQCSPVPAASFSGLDGETLRELLPACQCILRSLFIMFLDNATPAGRSKIME